jgi:hypothetical protein
MTFSSDKRQIADIEVYADFSKEFDYYIEFFQNLSELITYNGRIISFLTHEQIHHLDTSLIDSSLQTLRSIKLCCSIGSFADANALIRKLRDDLLLYIYILAVINHRNPFIEEDLAKVDINDAESFASSFSNIRLNNILTDDEQAINAWFNNSVEGLSRPIKMKLSFENYMKFLRQNENINEILIRYRLEEYWEKLRTRLNNYVHNNGRNFAFQNGVAATDKNVEIHLKNINIRVSYISCFFLTLLLMIEAALISSTDMIDYLDSNMKPPEDCQYLIANFVQEFIDAKITKLHPELKQYLKDNNNYGMKIE